MAWVRKKSQDFGGSTSTSGWTWKHTAIEYWQDDKNDGNYYLTSNKSLVRIVSYLGRSGSSSYFGGVANVRVDAEKNTSNTSSTSKTFSYPTNVSAGGWVEAYRFDFIVTHNNDGTKTITTYSSLSSSAFSPSSASAEGKFTLTTIPRATDLPSFSTGNIESEYLLTISPKIQNATHSYKISFGTIAKWLQADGTLGDTQIKLTGTEHIFKIPTTYYSQFNGTATGQGDMYLYTYSGNTLIGTKHKQFKATCNPALCTPIIDATAVDINPITTALTNDPTIVVANASNVLITPTIKISDDDDTATTIVSKKVNEVAFVEDTYTVFNAASDYFNVSVTNSRTYSTSKTITTGGGLIPYVPLSFNIVNLRRVEPTTGEVAIEYNGNYYNGAFGFDEETATKNELILSWSYREKDSTEWNNTTPLSLDVDLSGDTIVCSIPDNFGNTIMDNWDGETTEFIFARNDRYIIAYSVTGVHVAVLVHDSVENTSELIYMYSTTSGVLENNPAVVLASDFGNLTTIDTDNILYNYIKIIGVTYLTNYTIKDNTFSGEESLGTIFDYTKQYEFLFVYNDKVMEGSQKAYITRGFPIFWWSEDAVHIIGDLYVKDQLISGGGTTNNIYSTEEHVIGTWVDGKTLYRKFIAIGSVGTTEVTTPLNITNLNVITYLGGGGYMASGHYLPWNFENSGGFSSCYYNANSKGLRSIVSTDNYKMNDCYAIVEYTKTTG